MSKQTPKILTVALMAIVSIMLLGRSSFAASGFVTDNGRDLVLNGNTFKSVGVNRYNLMTTGGTPFVGCGGTFKDSELASWFSELHTMGVTTVRFWLFQQFTKSGSDLKRFDYLLSLAQQNNVKLIPVFENQWSDCTQGGRKTSSWYQSGYRSPYGSYPLSLKDYIGKIVPNYANNPNILMWQIMNEAEDSDTTSFYNFAKDVSGYIKSQDKNHLVSFGTMGSGQAGSSVYKKIHALSTIDVLEYHDYNNETVALPSTLNDRINDSISLNKPLMVGEAGIKLSDYSADQRSGYFNSKMAAFFKNSGSAYLIWSYRDMDNKATGYEFVASDPLAGVISSYTKGFGSVSAASTVTTTPTVSPTVVPQANITPSPTVQPTATVTPSVAPTVMPTAGPTSSTSSTKLGGMNLSGFSISLGYGQNVKIVNGVWVFSVNGQAIDMTSACKWQYKTDSAFAVEVYSGNPYSWACFSQ